MKTVFRYYVIDRAAEQVIGSFDANNDVVARRFIVNGLKSLFEKKQLSPDDILVYKSRDGFDLYESFVELVPEVVRVVFDLSRDFQEEFKEFLKDEK